MELKIEDFNWVTLPVKGMALLIMSGEIDSFNDSIKADKYYWVGKHKESKKVAIVPIHAISTAPKPSNAAHP